MVQVSFLKKIAGLGAMDYWEQLATLKLYSLERRRDRYIAIYIWKVMEGLVPNFGINVGCHRRNGRYGVIPVVRSTASHKIQTIRFNSLAVKGPQIFNSLPASIRNKTGCSVDTFKAALDDYLQHVPDEPRIGKLIKFCRKGSNSITQYWWILCTSVMLFLCLRPLRTETLGPTRGNELETSSWARGGRSVKSNPVKPS